MKIFSGVVLSLALSTGQAASPAPPVPVLVELFTSEGCSSCPAADDILAALVREQPVAGVDVVAVGLHVDYFDHKGWKDAFSSAAYTERQQEYSRIFGPDSVYTPQMVVDGQEAVEGNDAAVVHKAIGSASRRPHLPIHLTVRVVGGQVQIAADVPAAPSDDEPIQVMAAVIEDSLTSIVKKGENRGRTLHHVAVARRVEHLDALRHTDAVVQGRLALKRSWALESLKAIVWLQGAKSRRVYGAAVSTLTR